MPAFEITQGCKTLTWALPLGVVQGSGENLGVLTITKGSLAVKRMTCKAKVQERRELWDWRDSIVGEALAFTCWAVFDP